MKGCFLWFLGIFIGAALVILAQVALIRPPSIRPLAPSDSDMVILYKSEYLTRLLNAQASRFDLPTPVEDLTVRAEPGNQLIVGGSATSTVLGRSIRVPLSLVARPTIENGQLKFQIARAQVGGLPLPVSVSQGLDQPINQLVSHALLGTTYRIVGVNTTTEGLVVDVAWID